MSFLYSSLSDLKPLPLERRPNDSLLVSVFQHLVGRLIGKQGRYVSFLKQSSGAKIYISTLPYTQEFQICHMEGRTQLGAWCSITYKLFSLHFLSWSPKCSSLSWKASHTISNSVAVWSPFASVIDVALQTCLSVTPQVSHVERLYLPVHVVRVPASLPFWFCPFPSWRFLLLVPQVRSSRWIKHWPWLGRSSKTWTWPTCTLPLPPHSRCPHCPWPPG